MQKTELMKLSQIKVNSENPRTISGDKFQKLVNSILAFPKMLEIRPVVINSEYKALGGNMRTNALNYIKQMQKEQLFERLHGLSDYQKLTTGEKRVLDGYWQKFMKDPAVPCIKADELTADEQKQFIIKDNVQFGAWDFDALANEFDETELGDWGMDVWQQTTDFNVSTLGGASGSGAIDGVPDSSEDDGNMVLEMPTSFDDNDKEEKPFVVKITFKDEMQVKSFEEKYKQQLIDDYNCIMSVSGGML